MNKNLYESLNEYHDTKVIFELHCAKYLLERGFKLVNIKAHKNDSSQTIFVFKDTSASGMDIADALSDFNNPEER